MANCVVNLNELEQLSGCPADTEDVLFIGFSGFSGFSGLGLREWDDLTQCTISGFSGFSGFSGSGFSGYSGVSGTSGYSGFSGHSGFSTSGHSGYSGVSGASGKSGNSGVTPVSLGASGYSGLSGDDGSGAVSGYSGKSGDNPGLSGYSGKSGFSGFDASAVDTWRTIWSAAFSNPTLNATTTGFAQFPGQTFFSTEITREYILPEDCSAENMFIHTSGTQPLSGDLIITVRKNFVDTALIITIPAGGSATTWSNTTDIVSFVAGDIITVRYENLASAASLDVLSNAVSLFKV